MDAPKEGKHQVSSKSAPLSERLYNLTCEIERIYQDRTELMSHEDAMKLAEKFEVPADMMVWFYA